MMRSVLLSLSRQSWLRGWMETSSVAGKLTSRFVAGETLEQGLAVCGRLAEEGYLATLDHLGENVTSLAEACKSRDAYLRTLDRIAAMQIGGTISIKLSQFGLDLSRNACVANVEELVRTARDRGSRVEIDMEGSEYTEVTLDIVQQLHAKFGSVRAVLQAYLYRTAGDVETLSGAGIPIRLCKGAYREAADVAYPKKSDVDDNYCRLVERLLDTGTYPAIASHDERMVNHALEYAQSHSFEPSRWEFQMLYGIRRDLQKRIVDGGYRLRLYVPFGDAWYPYFMRRLAERPANVLFLARNLLRS